MLQQESRDYSMDNLRFFLMFFVVLGHLLDIYPVVYQNLLFRLIYLFHMPCFIFVSGYFAKARAGFTDLVRDILRYLLFQTLYLLFARYVLSADIPVQYLTPYWILWYTLVLTQYRLLLLVLPLPTGKSRLWAVTISLSVSLAAGFVPDIGHFLSLSRALGFLPFFLLGYWFRLEEPKLHNVFQPIPQPRLWIPVVSGLAASLPVALDAQRVPRAVLYRSAPYASGIGNLLQRLVVNWIGLCWILLLLSLFRGCFRRKLPFISRAGANTLPVFLLHGFLVEYLAHTGLFQPGSFLLLLMMSLTILLILGNPVLSRLFSCKPGKKLYNKRK